MNIEKKQQARNLFFQTELTKSQIATLLGISRRSLTYWIKEGSWQRLKKSAAHLPAILAENCYHLIGNLTEHYLSERRLTNPVSSKEVDALHKLTITVGKLRNRSTLNESMEMFGFFVDGLKIKNAQLAEDILPYIDEYISSRADMYRSDLLPPHFTGVGGRIPWIQEDNTEAQIDRQEAFFSDPDIIEAYAAAGIELPGEEEINTPPVDTPLPPPYTREDRNKENLAKLQQTCLHENSYLHTASIADLDDVITPPKVKNSEEVNLDPDEEYQSPYLFKNARRFKTKNDADCATFEQKSAKNEQELDAENKTIE